MKNSCYYFDVCVWCKPSFIIISAFNIAPFAPLTLHLQGIPMPFYLLFLCFHITIAFIVLPDESKKVTHLKYLVVRVVPSFDR